MDIVEASYSTVATCNVEWCCLRQKRQRFEVWHTLTWWGSRQLKHRFFALTNSRRWLTAFSRYFGHMTRYNVSSYTAHCGTAAVAAYALAFDCEVELGTCYLNGIITRSIDSRVWTRPTRNYSKSPKEGGVDFAPRVVSHFFNDSTSSLRMIMKTMMWSQDRTFESFESVERLFNIAEKALYFRCSFQFTVICKADNCASIRTRLFF